VLRITAIDEGASGIRLKLEGRIAGRWVPELESECRRYLGVRPLSLDLADVSTVDGPGATLLKTLAAGKVPLMNCSPFVAEQLEDLGC
jgi:hypothetical protein